MPKFMMGPRGEGRSIALQQYHKELKEKVRRASYEVSVRNNDETRLLYDKAIEDLLAFEQEFGHLLREREER